MLKRLGERVTMWINAWQEKLKVPKLSLIIVGYVVLSLAVSVMTYRILANAIGSLTSKIVNLSPYYEKQVDEVAQRFQAYVTVNKISSDDSRAIARWNQEEYNYWIYIYVNDKLLFNSKNLWIEIDQIEIMDIPHSYSIEFTDQEAELVIFPFFNFEFLYGIKSVCFIASTLVFIFLFLVLLHRKIAYLLYISHCVERMQGGDLSLQIKPGGKDEITSLALNINEMATVLDHQIQTEKLLKQQQTEMIASLSHDLRTPLTSIISYLEFIQQHHYESEAKRDEYTRIVYQKSIQIKQLIEQLFEQVTSQDKVVPTNSEILEGEHLILETLNEFETSLVYEGFTVKKEVDLPESFSLLMKLHDFYRLMDNLYSNLLKYADDLKEVRFKIDQEGDQLRLCLSNGVNPSLKCETESHGIGLKNCDQILRKYGGKLEIFENNQIFNQSIYLPILKIEIKERVLNEIVE